MMVDDEENLGRMQGRLLEGLGYSVTLHASSLAALEDFRSRPDEFDLLVTDNTMPKLTGLQLAQELHTIRGDLPVIMVSGLAERSEGLDLHTMGIQVLLRKPHTSGELDAAIREALRFTSQS
jgi:DNA-binding response OmpR family regulator